MAGPQTSSTVVPTSTSRRRPPPSGEEEATTRLKLGDMEGMEALSVAEVNSLLKGFEGSIGKNATEIFTKTREYCETFARFKDPNSIDQVYRLSQMLASSEPTITKFERAQLATLCCDTAEEARTLIPSLEGKLSDEQLQNTLDEISKYRDFS